VLKIKNLFYSTLFFLKGKTKTLGKLEVIFFSPKVKVILHEKAELNWLFL